MFLFFLEIFIPIVITLQLHFKITYVWTSVTRMAFPLTQCCQTAADSAVPRHLFQSCLVTATTIVKCMHWPEFGKLLATFEFCQFRQILRIFNISYSVENFLRTQTHAIKIRISVFFSLQNVPKKFSSTKKEKA